MRGRPGIVTSRWALAALCAVSLLPGATVAAYDVLDLPAQPSAMASHALIHAVRKIGERHFAVGQRGHILYSDDDGASWTQAEVPVRSDLLDIDFPTPQLGWAVGHEAVILHSADGGRTWVKQFDGLRYGTEGKAFYTDLAAEDPNNPLFPVLVDEMDFAIAQGADKPLFNVHFLSATFGYAAGAYGMILRTDDAGEHWEPVLHHIDNDNFNHLFDFAPLPDKGKFFITGEAGLFLIGDVRERHARRVHAVPWEGSFFTSTAAADGAIVLGGLRGRMFRTTDAGDSWTVVSKPETSAIVDSTRLADGALIAVGVGGEVLRSTDNGLTFAQLPIALGERIYTVAAGAPGKLLIGGPRGIRQLDLPSAPDPRATGD